MEPSWLLYLGIALGPFVQEDAAVLAAATLSASDPQHFPNVFIFILIGLILSDIWKYWIGWAALSNDKARAFTEKKHIADLKDKVQQHTILTLLGARFIPLARIPAYVACGYFGISYLKFCLTIALTALLYTVIIFIACHYLGEIVGDKLEMMLPLIGGVFLLIFGAIIVWRYRMAKKHSKTP